MQYTVEIITVYGSNNVHENTYIFYRGPENKLDSYVIANVLVKAS